MSDIVRQKIEDSKWGKYEGIAPDGFTLIPTELLEILKDFDEWKEFKNDPNWIADKSKEIVKAWP
jgi:hypothetical protein